MSDLHPNGWEALRAFLILYGTLAAIGLVAGVIWGLLTGGHF